MRGRGGRTAAWLAYACGLVFTATVAPAWAHHSFALFNHEHQIKLYGTVERFEWTNPHVYIYLDVDSGSGNGTVKDYTIECPSPAILNRTHWKWNMIKVGDKITVIIAPLRSGLPGGLIKEVKLADGQTFVGGTTGKPTISID